MRFGSSMHARSIASERRSLASTQEQEDVSGRSAVAAPRTAAVRPLRVAFVLYRDDSNLGGSLRVVETLAKALDPRRVEAHIVFTYGGPGPVARRASVPCHFLNSRGPHDVAGWWRARRLIDG